MPGASLIEKCRANLRNGAIPVIITIFDRVHTAMTLAEDAGLAGRVEVWDIQQFLSANVYPPLFNFVELECCKCLLKMLGEANQPSVQ